MKKTILLFIGFWTMTIQNTYSQSFEVPKDYKLKTEADFDVYADDIVEAAKWLESVSLNEQKEKREEVSKFVVIWISGSPKVTVEIFSIILDFEKKNKGMMVLYMASCARNVIKNKYSVEVDAKQKYGLKSLMKVYTEGKGIKKDKKMDKLIEMDAEGKLDEWIKKNFK